MQLKARKTLKSSKFLRVAFLTVYSKLVLLINGYSEAKRYDPVSSNIWNEDSEDDARYKHSLSNLHFVNGGMS